MRRKKAMFVVIIRKEFSRSNERHTSLDSSTVSSKRNKVRKDTDMYRDTAQWERTAGDQRQDDPNSSQKGDCRPPRHKYDTGARKKRTTIFTVLKKKVTANPEFYSQWCYFKRKGDVKTFSGKMIFYCQKIFLKNLTEHEEEVESRWEEEAGRESSKHAGRSERAQTE